MITGLPEGPAGFAVVMAIFVALTALVMCLKPIWEWIEKQVKRRREARYEEQQIHYRIEQMGQNDELLNRKEVK